jgi:excinuclease UvrABC ATPase subunit
LKKQVFIKTNCKLEPFKSNGSGIVVATGTPENVTASKKSITGRYLKEELKV